MSVLEKFGYSLVLWSSLKPVTFKIFCLLKQTSDNVFIGSYEKKSMY